MPSTAPASSDPAAEPDPEELLTREQAAAFLGIHISTLTRILAANKIEQVRLGPNGGIVRIRRGALIDYRRACTQPAVRPRRRSNR